MLTPDLAAQSGGIRVAPQKVETIRSVRLADRLSDRVRESGGHVLIGINRQNPASACQRSHILALSRHRGVPSLVEAQILASLQVLPSPVGRAVIEHYDLVAER